MSDQRRGNSSLHFASVFYVIGLILACTSVGLLLPLITAFLYEEVQGQIAFGITIATSLVIGLGLFFSLKPHFDPRALRQREACFIVTFAWVAIAGLAAMPYMLTGSFVATGPWGWLEIFTNSYFEALSGLTTTGASVVNDIPGLSRSILLWRSESQWLGGMGIILLSIAILPLLGVGGMQLFKAEVPGISVDKLTPRISDTAKSLWLLYVLLTLAEFFLLCFKMSPFDALCHAFSTLSTGGFSPMGASVEDYHSAYVDLVITAFMFMGGVNFVLIYKLFQGKLRDIWADQEFKVYAVMILLVLGLITGNLLHEGVFTHAADATRHALFQIVSVATTTGFSSQNWETWPVFSQTLLLTLMIGGGMAGSTAGGAKLIRLVILFKYAWRELLTIIHPRAVISIKLGGQPVSRDVLRAVLAFFTIMSFLLISGTLALTAMGIDFSTSISAVLTSISNVGPGINRVGPGHNFEGLPILAKWILLFCMLLGRLEIYTAFVLLVPDFWRK